MEAGGDSSDSLNCTLAGQLPSFSYLAPDNCLFYCESDFLVRGLTTENCLNCNSDLIMKPPPGETCGRGEGAQEGLFPSLFSVITRLPGSPLLSPAALLHLSEHIPTTDGTRKAQSLLQEPGVPPKGHGSHIGELIGSFTVSK